MSELLDEIIIEKSSCELEDVIYDYPVDKQRFLFFSGKINKSPTIKRLRFYDDKITYSNIEYRYCFGKKIYKQKTTISGFTYNKTTKKLFIWYGKTINSFGKGEILMILKHLNIDWLKQEYKIITLLRKSSFERILSGKITNPIQLCKYYLKTSIKSDASPKLFFELLRDGCDLQDIIRLLPYVKNHDNLLKEMKSKGKLANYEYRKIINDMTYDCKILDKKIDTNWSYKRLLNEHRNNTVKIVELELETLGNHIVEYEGEITPPDNCEILNSQREVFIESKIQSNCIYTHYWGMIKTKEYFALRMLSPERCTVGITYENDKYVLDQIFLANNKPVNDKTKEIILKWLDKPNVIEFLSKNITKTSFSDHIWETIEQLI